MKEQFEGKKKRVTFLRAKKEVGSIRSVTYTVESKGKGFVQGRQIKEGYFNSYG